MWQIQNRTPFAAGQGWVRGSNGAETWLVVVKATFDIRPDGSTRVADVQPDVVRSPIYRNDDPESGSTLYDNDFVLTKPTTDVVVNATAYAPDGQPVTSLDVGVRVGQMSKTLRVFGDRQWGPSGSWLSSPVPFRSMPVVYERAFGGIDAAATPGSHRYWANPVGTGFASSSSSIDRTMAPNIEYPDQLIGSWRDRPAPAGLGVIASHWEERARFSGTYDDAWLADRQPLLPSDFDARHYQLTPRDQQAPAYMTGGEEVAALGLTPSGSLRTRVPMMELALETRFMDGRRHRHDPPRLHTLILEPDFPRLTLIWHSALECHPLVYQLERTRIDVRLDGVLHDEGPADLLELVS